MLILESPQLVQQTVRCWKNDHPIALVPTMGCLHDGHLALIRRARELASRCVVSLFVNPLQFGPNEDYANYPRTFDEDASKLKALGVDLLFQPTVEGFYPEGFNTRVRVGRLSEVMEGKSRPGHFEGVATVCLKLFQITLADIAVFGEKDFQQLSLIQNLCSDLNLPIRIVSHPTVREIDGLAMSSRNRYLSTPVRSRASKLPHALRQMKDWASRNPSSLVREICELGRSQLAPDFQVDYIEVASTKDCIPAGPDTRLCEIQHPRVFVAARIENTRLIDNALLVGESL